MAHSQLFGGVLRAISAARATLPQSSTHALRAITRRSALMLMAAACAPGRTPQAPAAPSATAIIGGGTSGLVVAWRLANAGIPCEIFEASGRTGGRMYTLRDFTPQGHFCELGGEFVDPAHVELIKLCEELGIKIQPVHAENSGSDLFDFGGRSYYTGDFLDRVSRTGAFLPVAAQISADQAVLLDGDGNWTPRAYELDALPLSKYLERLKQSTEGWVITLIALACHAEYGIPIDKQSSLNLVDTLETGGEPGLEIVGDSQEALRIKDGSGALPQILTERLLSPPLSARVSINLRHELTRISKDGVGYGLSFRTPDKPALVRTFSRVVLALPFTRLRDLRGLDSLGLTAEKMIAIARLGYGENAKLMVGTSSRPWRQRPEGANPLLSGTIYSDRGFQIVWDTSAGQERDGGVLTNFVTGPAARSEEAGVLATLMAGLKALSPDIAEAVDPLVRTSFFWPLHPHTRASYAGALTGQYTHFFEYAARSELNDTLFFAGEHTSAKSAGFMNGAVEAGERVAREILAAS